MLVFIFVSYSEILIPYQISETIMQPNFEIINEFKLDKFIRDKSATNTLKHMLLQRKATRSLFKNFILIIYFLYFRLSLEMGTAMLTTYEACIVNGVFVLIVIAVIDQGSRFLFSAIVKLFYFSKEIFWIYRNIDSIRKLKLDH